MRPVSRAADQGFARAFHNLAIFWQEDHTGFGVDYARARALAEEAIALGFVDEETFDKVVRPEDMIGPK